MQRVCAVLILRDFAKLLSEEYQFTALSAMNEQTTSSSTQCVVKIHDVCLSDE